MSFWSATYLWDFINYMIPATIVIFLILMFQLDAFSDTETVGSIYFLLVSVVGACSLPSIHTHLRKGKYGLSIYMPYTHIKRIYVATV